MPLDVPSHSFALPEGVDPPALVSFLGDRFDVAADRATSLTYTVVDTADRRVRAAGAELRAEPSRRGVTFTLHEQAGAAPLTADVARRRRWLVDDLPAGPLRDHLAPEIEMRALLPLARVRVDVQSLQVRNSDEKTVVRLRLATHAALDTGGDPAPLTPRLEVSGVLGYGRPLARVVQALTTEAGLVDAPGSMADEAIAASGGDPDGLRSKVQVDLRPDQRTDRAAVAVLRDLAGMVDANLPGTLADLDTEFLHDLRVAVRRSRSVLRELKGAFAPDPLAAQRAALKWIQAVTGPTRDLDVQLLEWDALVADLPPETRASLAPVRDLLGRHRAAALRNLKRELRGTEFRQSWAGYRAFLDGKLGPARDRPDARRPIAEVAGERIVTVYGRMVKAGSAIDDRSPATDLHELRKRGKELRYLLEFFGGLWPSAVARPMVKSLKGLQDVLGTHQDREVQADHLRGLADELATTAGGPEALLALGVLVDRLFAQQHEARSHFAESFAAFAAPEQRKLVARTFGAAP
ncbi:MAG TPA: CHAD domain-containing protein [Acidimicrobiales bacterium]|nr:CHAD domain-containing protein [Acidimicrobiales bacterium]